VSIKNSQQTGAVLDVAFMDVDVEDDVAFGEEDTTAVVLGVDGGGSGSGGSGGGG